MDEKQTKVAIIVGMFLLPLMVLVMVPQIAFDSFVIVKIWDWLIVPHFNLAPMTWWCAIGISLLVSITSMQYVDVKDADWKPFLQNVLRSAFALALAFAVKSIAF